MIAFIIAFRHPDSTNDYNHVLQLLKATLDSLINQVDGDFKVYIGCNVKPELNVVDPRVSFCTIDCPLPKNRKEVLLDRGVKRALAIQTATNEINPELIFLLDADDLVSKYFVTELKLKNFNTSSGGYWLERGYLLDLYNERVQEKYGFNRYCGSSLILNNRVIVDKLFTVKVNLQVMITYSEFINYCDPYVLEHVLGDHVAAKPYMASLGYSMEKILRPMVCWKINTGENESKTKIPYGSKNMSSEFLSMFSITTIKERKAIFFERLVERLRFLQSLIASTLASVNS